MQYQPQEVMAGRVHQAALADQRSHTRAVVVVAVAVELREMAARAVVGMVLHQLAVLRAPQIPAVVVGVALQTQV